MKISFIKFGLLAGITTALVHVPTDVVASDHGSSEGRWQLRGRLIDIRAAGDGEIEQNGLKTDVENAITPEFDVTYFFSDNVAAELIAATAEHDIQAGTFDVGSAWILPPTLTVQYHFSPHSDFSPYVGVGLNYSLFYGEDEDTGFNDLDVDGGVGYAAQAGFDYWLDDHWGVNFDVKYVKLEVDVDVKLGTTQLNADDVDLDPLIVGAGVSYRF